MRAVFLWVFRGVLALAAFVALTLFFNAPWWASSRGTVTLLAHRGMAQTYPRAGLTNETCTAARIDTPEHAYLENTIASMQAAFDAGADIVEFDVHPTTDGQFAVFHDWTLDCRTEGHGVTREHAMAYLKTLDIGYGYTADGGKTFPFRGKGVGLMPSLDEVLIAFPDKRFLINVKSNDPEEGALLAARLDQLPGARLAQLMAYGGDKPMAALRAKLPSLHVMSRKTMTECVLNYIGYGWTGIVPQACHDTLIVMPINVAPYLWGWPDLYLERMERAGTFVFVAGPYGEGEAGAAGLDDAATFARLPPDYAGGIWTNRVDRIAPLIKR